MRRIIPVLFLAAISSVWPAECRANRSSPVTVGPGKTYSSWNAAATACAGTYSADLVFELYPFLDTSVAEFTGFSFSSGKKLVIVGKSSDSGWTGVNAKWESDSTKSFISKATPDPTKGYALRVEASTAEIRDVQFKANINDDWGGGNGVLLLKGNVAVEDCFIWMYTPTSVNWTQNGTGIKIINGGNYDFNNVVIYGDYRATPGYAHFFYGIWAGTYSGNIQVRNATIYGRGVVANPPTGPETDKPFTGGIYRLGGFTINVSNSYIAANGPCTKAGSGSFNGDYNLCNGTEVVGSNSDFSEQPGNYAFNDPRNTTAPDFSLISGSELVGFGNTSAIHTDVDINGASRPGSGSIDIGVAEY